MYFWFIGKKYSKGLLTLGPSSSTNPKGYCCCDFWSRFEAVNFWEEVSMDYVPAMRAINLLSSLKCHPHIIQLICLTLLCLKQSTGINPPPSLLLPQHTFQHISVILLLFPFDSNPSTPWYTFKHWPWPLLSGTRVCWKEEPWRICVLLPCS